MCRYIGLRDTNKVWYTCRLSRGNSIFLAERKVANANIFSRDVTSLLLWINCMLIRNKVPQRANYFRREAIFLKFTDANLSGRRRIITILKPDNLCNKFLKKEKERGRESCLYRQEGISIINRKGNNP